MSGATRHDVAMKQNISLPGEAYCAIQPFSVTSNQRRRHVARSNPLNNKCMPDGIIQASQQGVRILLGAMSSPADIYVRDAVRRTWLANTIDTTVLTCFVVGAESILGPSVLDEEARTRGDLFRSISRGTRAD